MKPRLTHSAAPSSVIDAGSLDDAEKHVQYQREKRFAADPRSRDDACLQLFDAG